MRTNYTYANYNMQHEQDGSPGQFAKISSIYAVDF